MKIKLISKIKTNKDGKPFILYRVRGSKRASESEISQKTYENPKQIMPDDMSWYPYSHNI